MARSINADTRPVVAGAIPVDTIKRSSLVRLVHGPPQTYPPAVVIKRSRKRGLPVGRKPLEEPPII